MFKIMKKRIKNEKGLTLVELLAVIVILAIVAAIAVPAIGNIINNSRDRAILSEASNVLGAAKIAVIDNACGAEVRNVITCDDSVLNNYLDGELASGDKVTYDSSLKEYKITYSEFAKIKDKTKYGENITRNAISEDDLIKNLEK